MFLEQTRPHFLAKFKATCFKLGKKRYCTVFPRHFALYNILQNTDNNLNQNTYLVKFKTCPLKKKSNLRKN